MKEITIKYWGHHGRQEERKFQCSDRKIDMIMRAAQRVDLSEVKKCIALEVLNLSSNMLDEIDLTPLAECKTLKAIDLRNNHLTELDLWPLSDCTSLMTLKLIENRLSGLDLTPIFVRANIDMDSSVVISADFILRFFLPNKQLSGRFLLARPDKAPWYATPVIIWNKYEVLAERMEWSEIRKRITTVLNQVENSDWFAVQRALLMGFSLDELAGYDGDPMNLLSTTTPDMDFLTAKNAIFNRTIDLLEDQIESGGSMLLLEIEGMETTKASKLIPKIIEARAAEIENIVVHRVINNDRGQRVPSLESVWLTYYGCQMMMALEPGREPYDSILDKLKESFDELGFELKIEEVTSYSGNEVNLPIRASDSLRTHIYRIISGAYSSEVPRLPSSQP